MDAAWGSTPPAGGRKVLPTHINSLRRSLDPENTRPHRIGDPQRQGLVPPRRRGDPARHGGAGRAEQGGNRPPSRRGPPTLDPRPPPPKDGRHRR
ncbi:hypothetical protein [Streptomyces griseus]|uniref:hypothetical protein n=1 Tax=Streptomyces griseus TaxID=1911 RepID=UPI0036A0B627